MIQRDLVSYLQAAKINTDIAPLANLEYDSIDISYVIAVWSAWVESLDISLKERVMVCGPGYDTNGKQTIDAVYQWQPKYLLPSFDCAQMAFSFTNAMILGSAQAASKEAGSGKPVRNTPAFGYIYFVISKGSYMGDQNVGFRHAINWFLDFNNQVHFFEKQTGNEVKLTQDEVSSIFSLVAS